jgi:hypothetical protein
VGGREEVVVVMESRSIRKRLELRAKMKVLGLYLREYGADDGTIQARIFINPRSDFFSGDHIWHSPNRGIKVVMAFVDGYRAGKESEGWKKR